MKNRVLALTLVPVIIISSFFLISFIFTYLLKGQLGQYNNIDLAIKKAKVIQEDMTNAQSYGSNYYDIGNYGGSLSGLLKVAPTAFIAGMFRPFLWESKKYSDDDIGFGKLFLINHDNLPAYPVKSYPVLSICVYRSYIDFFFPLCCFLYVCSRVGICKFWRFGKI